MRGSSLWVLFILAGLAVGIAVGLIYAWTIAPVQYFDTTPNQLRSDLKEEYLLLIAETYASDGDWPAAIKRLEHLRETNLTDVVQAVTEKAIAEGKPINTVRNLAALAVSLGVENPAFSPFLSFNLIENTPTPVLIPAILPTPSPTKSVHTITPSNTPSSTPLPSPTIEPTQTRQPTPEPTRTLRPTDEPVVKYKLIAQQSICDSVRDDPTIQVIVRNSDREGIPGLEVAVVWETGVARMFTGLKPEMGLGYADVIIKPNEFYSVNLVDGSELITGIDTFPCSSSSGERLASTRLIFEALDES